MTEREAYSVGYSSHVTALFAQRTALREARYFAERLGAGMTVLDCGCGPGSITEGIAEIVAPGHVVGVDLEPAQVEFASRSAQARGLTNCEFQVASVYALPFPDHAFDGAHMNAVLCQLREPVRALCELRRVVKPGGLIGVRDMDWGGQIVYPADPELMRAQELRERAIGSMGGDYRIGRRLRELLVLAEVKPVVFGATCETLDTPERLAEVCEYMAKQWESAPFAREVVHRGWATVHDTAVFAARLRAFAGLPNSFQTWVWCNAVGRV